MIDFEFAAILDEKGEGPPPVDLNAVRGAAKTRRKPPPGEGGGGKRGRR